MPDLNRELSELVEPITVYLDALDLDAAQEWLDRQHDRNAVCYSPKRAWTLAFTVNRGGYINVGATWQPRAWDTDETANAQILDMILQRGYEITLRRDEMTFYGAQGYWREHADNRKQAIRDAALRILQAEALLKQLTHKRQTGGKD